VNVVHVPYKGGAPMMTDLLGGHLSFGFTSILTALSHVKAGKLVVLGNGATKRSPLLPDVPTMVEAGLAGYEANAWYGIFGPANVPREIVARIHDGIAKAAATPDLREKIQSQGGEPVVNAPDAFAEFTRREQAKCAKVVKDAGIQPE
jgi:tripartite-type tricarboxylate transporter receptor subunit TctC